MRCLKGLPVRSNLVLAVAIAVTMVAVCGCGNRAMMAAGQAATGGNAVRGKAAIFKYGCGSCHIIPGISNAHGLVGPPLSGIASRVYVAGVLQNTPGNMVRWIENPHAVDEHTVMPALGVSHQDAADIAAYLYTLR
jgi:cytochrome c2